jgi:hypothetical protein
MSIIGILILAVDGAQRLFDHLKMGDSKLRWVGLTTALRGNNILGVDSCATALLRGCSD